MEDHTSLIGHSGKLSRKLELITGLTLHITPRRAVNQMGRSWRSKLSEVLWAYRLTYKMPIGMTPYQLVYGKTCHLLVEIEYKAFWAIKKWNMDLKAARTKRKI
jgi:hypothetical protein